MSPTSKQLAVIEILVESERASGRDVRAELEKLGIKQSRPAFYLMMQRCEEAGWIKGKYHTNDVEGTKVRERRYTALAHGHRALHETPKPRRRPSRIRTALILLALSAAITVPWLLILWLVGLITL